MLTTLSLSVMLLLIIITNTLRPCDLFVPGDSATEICCTIILSFRNCAKGRCIKIEVVDASVADIADEAYSAI